MIHGARLRNNLSNSLFTDIAAEMNQHIKRGTTIAAAHQDLKSLERSHNTKEGVGPSFILGGILFPVTKILTVLVHCGLGIANSPNFKVARLCDMTQ